MLIDSNIIIYASQPERAWLPRFIAEQAPAVSAVSGRTLVTRNTKDFEWVPELKVLNPFEDYPSSSEEEQ